MGSCYVVPNVAAPNILIHTVYHHTNLKSWNTCNGTQFLGHLTVTEYRTLLRIAAVITASFTPSTEQRTLHYFIRALFSPVVI